jgi:G1/S-specific cyclin-D2
MMMADLLCLEFLDSPTPPPRRSLRDPVILNDVRVLRNLLEVDERHTPSTSYFNIQMDLNPCMRKTLTRWMLEVTLEENLEEEIFPLSVIYLDRFLSVSSLPIRRTQLQLIGCVCLFIASKFKSSLPLKAENLVWFTASSITHDELIEWELVVLQGLRWDLSSITPYDFLDHLFSRLPLATDDMTSLRKHATILIDLSTTDVKLSSSPSSMIAASCILAAVNGHPCHDRYTNSNLLHRLAEITSIDKDLIRVCQDQIEALLFASIAESQSQKQDSNNASLDSKPSSTHAKQPNTPTDVRDVTLVDRKK